MPVVCDDAKPVSHESTLLRLFAQLAAPVSNPPNTPESNEVASLSTPRNSTEECLISKMLLKALDVTGAEEHIDSAKSLMIICTHHAKAEWFTDDLAVSLLEALARLNQHTALNSHELARAVLAVSEGRETYPDILPKASECLAAIDSQDAAQHLIALLTRTCSAHTASTNRNSQLYGQLIDSALPLLFSFDDLCPTQLRLVWDAVENTFPMGPAGHHRLLFYARAEKMRDKRAEQVENLRLFNFVDIPMDGPIPDTATAGLNQMPPLPTTRDVVATTRIRPLFTSEDRDEQLDLKVEIFYVDAKTYLVLFTADAEGCGDEISQRHLKKLAPLCDRFYGDDNRFLYATYHEPDSWLAVESSYYLYGDVRDFSHQGEYKVANPYPCDDRDELLDLAREE
jgi:hypothetical protein